MHTLVSFLGRTPRDSNGYRRMTYRLPDGSTEETAFIGYGLRRWLKADHLVVLGTTGSMWDHLFERDLVLQGHDDQRLALIEAVDDQVVTQQQLDQLAPLLTEALGCRVTLCLIPEALVPQEQAELLQTLAAASADAARLSIDVTHGFRHLPMLALMATLYLRSARPQLQIAGLWYGALRPGEKRSDVVDLSGLLHFADWLSALQRHDWLGDYGAIASLIEDREVGALLQQAAFKESIHQGQQARGLLRQARERLRQQPLQGPGALFQPLLEQRTGWVDGQHLYQRQRAQALNALERNDFLRASLYGLEAFITRLTKESADPGQLNNWAAREKAKEDYEWRKPSDTYSWYKSLRNTRNVLAHGNQAQEQAVQQALDSPDRLRQLLAECLNKLLPAEPA